ncbi:MAG: SurA N-terminal domain-containing protein [Candidatus Binatia bacterium]
MRDSRWIRETTPGVFLLALLLLFPWPARAEETEGVLATVDGRNITEAEIADKIAGQMVRINNQIYTAKRQAIDALISDHLIEAEAKKRGISREQLLQQEINAKVAAVSDAEVQQIYNTNKARVGNKTLAEVQPQIVQQLQQSKMQQQRQAFIQSLRKAAGVKVLLKPPVVDLAIEGAPVKGPGNAPVTIVEFSDFQ